MIGSLELNLHNTLNKKTTEHQIYKLIKKLFNAYKHKKVLKKYKRIILLNKYNRYIRTSYFTIYPKKYYNTYTEYIYKRYQRYTQRMEDLLYVEYMENAYRKYYNQVRFERDSYNSLEKERELFCEYDKLALMGMSLLFENPISHTFLIPKMKDIKRMYKDIKITNKYFVQMKRLEKTFIIPNSLRMSDPKIAYIIRKSPVYRIKKPINHNIIMNKDSMKGPPNIFKECFRTNTTIGYIRRKLNNCIHIKDKQRSNISNYVRKFYYDMKWNFIFINKIYRDIPGLLKKSLHYTHNILYKTNVALIELYNNTNKDVQTKSETSYRALLFISQIQFHEKIKFQSINVGQISINKTDKDIILILEYLLKILYIRVLTITKREAIRNIIKNRIINYYIPYVNIMSKQYLRSGYYAEMSDLVQEGTLGVIEAAERYQLGRGVRFLTYAYWWMHRYMIKIAIKKKKVFKINKKTKIQKKLLIRINALYEHLKKSLDTDSRKKNLNNRANSIYKNDIQQFKVLKENLQHRDFVIYALYKGIYPYKEHTIEQISTILEVPEYMIQSSLKRISKHILNV